MLITSATNSILHTINSDRETGVHERALKRPPFVAIIPALRALAHVIIKALNERFATGVGTGVASDR